MCGEVVIVMQLRQSSVEQLQQYGLAYQVHLCTFISVYQRDGACWSIIEVCAMNLPEAPASNRIWQLRETVCYMLLVLGNGCLSPELSVCYSESILHFSLISCVLCHHLMYAAWRLSFHLYSWGTWTSKNRILSQTHHRLGMQLTSSKWSKAQAGSSGMDAQHHKSEKDRICALFLTAKAS